MWHFKEEDEEDPERLELLEEEQEPLENIIEEDSSPTQRFNREEVNPFLEQEPVENLEQDLGQIPSQTDQTQEQGVQAEQPMLYNAPQYAGSYDAGDYENTRKESDMEVDTTGGALMERETTIQQPGQRRVDVAAWQQEHVTQMQSQQEKYQVRQPKQFKQQEALPFQEQDKPRGFG